MVQAEIRKATQKGKRLQAVWTDPKTGRERRVAFGQAGKEGVIGKEPNKKAFKDRFGTLAEALAAGHLAKWLAIKDWNRRLKVGDKVRIPRKLID
jgi:hypothetical protein